MEAIVALIVALVISLLIYLLGGAISVKAPKTGGKLEPYACGENFPPARSPIRLLFFNYVALFLIFDILALFLAFALSIPSTYKPVTLTLLITYGIVLGLSTYLLLRKE